MTIYIYRLPAQFSGVISLCLLRLIWTNERPECPHLISLTQLWCSRCCWRTQGWTGGYLSRHNIRQEQSSPNIYIFINPTNPTNPTNTQASELRPRVVIKEYPGRRRKSQYLVRSLSMSVMDDMVISAERAWSQNDIFWLGFIWFSQYFS